VAGKAAARPTPAPLQAILELRSSNRGLLLPRVADTNAITGGGIAGLLIYATKNNRVYLHNGTAWMQLCYSTNGAPGPASISSFTNCPGMVGGTFTQGVAGNGTLTLNYSGGNGGAYAAMSVASTGVTGLTAQLAAGTLTSNNGSLVFTVTGTPATSGTASFPVTLGGRTCIMTIPVNVGAGSISSFTNCPGAAGGAFTQGVAGNGTITLYYSGGNGGTYAAMNVASTGVTGLVAHLNAGSFTTGNGSLVFTVSGRPATAGTAYFTVTVGGRTCAMRITVAAAVPPVVNNVILTGSFTGYKNNGTLYPIIRPGSPLTVQYTYSGPPEGATVYTWYVTDRTWELDGNFDQFPYTWHVVKSGSGPANRTYTPGYQDLKHFIKCEVTPVTVSGIRGTTKSSNNNAYVYQ
jgi:hypothetical protein